MLKSSPLPPAPEEARSFAVYFVGSLLALVLIAGLCVFATKENSVRAVLLGAGLAIVFQLAKAAWSLEKKAQRAQNMELEIGDDGLHITDEKGQSQIVVWDKFESAEMRGGRLFLQWPSGKLEIGSREWENGMELTQTIARRIAGPQKPTNFIPLDSL